MIVKKYKTISTVLSSIILCQPFAQADENVNERQHRENREGRNKKLEEILVLGSRHANRESVHLKLDSDLIMDSLSSDEVGRLPDLNIADAFRRISGVQTINDSDEGRFITARGIDPDLNYITIDGMAVASQDDDGGRRVNLETIPSSFVNRLEVYKSQSASLDGNAIGSNINMVTLSAFDRSHFFLNGEAMLSHYTLDEVPNDNDDGLGGRLGLTVGNVWGDSEQFAYIFSASYNNKKRDEMKTSNDSYRYNNRFQSPVNSNIRTLQYTNEWDRWGGNLKLEFKPSTGFYAYLNSYFYAQQENEHRNLVSLINRDPGDEETDESNARVINIYQGRVDIAQNYQEYTYRPTDRENSGLHLHLNYELETGHQWTLDVSSARAVYDRPRKNFEFATERTSELAYTYDMSQLHTDVMLNNSSFIVDPNNYFLDSSYIQDDRQQETITEAKTDYSYALIDDVTLYAGAKYRESNRSYSRDRTIFDYHNNDEQLVLSAFYQDVRYMPRHYNYPIFMLSSDSFFDFYSANQNVFLTDAKSSYKKSIESDYKYQEKVTALYLMLDYRLAYFNINGGVRLETTDLKTDAFSYNRNKDSDPASQLEELYSPISNKGEYNHLLPSININIPFAETFKLRASYSQSIGRPNPSEVSARQSVEFSEEDNTYFINRGNPKLKPREASNYDLSMEYYFNESNSLFSAAVFRKNIKQLVFSGTSEHVRESGALEVISQKQNAHSAFINGIELGLVLDSTDFLPNPFKGFGLHTNVTFIDAGMTYIRANNDENHEESNSIISKVKLDHLLEQAETLANVTIFYGWNRGEISLGYHYSGEYSDNLRTDYSERDRLRTERLWRGFGQIDVQGHWKINDHFSLKGQIRNLGNKHRTRVTGENGSLFSEDVIFGQSYWLGFDYIM